MVPTHVLPHAQPGTAPQLALAIEQLAGVPLHATQRPAEHVPVTQSLSEVHDVRHARSRHA
jgi:hypothetical protein